jgi:hypothetical protein
MFLDSVVDPQFRLDDFAVASTAARERNFSRLAAWISLRHDTYHLGTNPEQVRAAILALRRTYDADPKQYIDLPMPIDGAVIASLASQSAPDWPQVSQAFRELQDSNGPTAPASLKEIFGGGPTIIVPGAPEIQNTTMRQAALCNEDPSRLDFSAAWAAYERRIEESPVTGLATRFSADCAGWPLPVQELQLHRTGGSLVLSGHRYESGTPYEWTQHANSLIGGTVFTVNDDVHAAALKVSDCAAEVVSYFTTGRIDQGCDGVPAP